MINSLEKDVQTVELEYIAWACECANWATSEDIKRYSQNFGDSLAKISIFIEPASDDLILPDTIGYSGDLVRFKGQFYKKKGFPKGYFSWQDPPKARVFRYSEYEIIVSNHKEYIKEWGEN